MKLKHNQIAQVKLHLRKQQNDICPLCETTMARLPLKDIVLDHCHRTGHIRAVLCRNCNGMEGQIWNRATRAKRTSTAVQWLTRLLAYWIKYATPQTKYIYPTHKTADDKRIRRNKLAREKRVKQKVK